MEIKSSDKRKKSSCLSKITPLTTVSNIDQSSIRYQLAYTRLYGQITKKCPRRDCNLTDIMLSLVVSREHVSSYTRETSRLTAVDETAAFTTVRFKKIPPPACGFLTFLDKRLRILNQFLHTYYTFLSALDTNFYSVISNFNEVMPH